jgi:hypothetical protein
MATTKQGAKPAEVNDMYDMDSVPETTNNAPARIDKPGITHNLKIGFQLVEGDLKSEEAKKESKTGKWHGFEVILTDEAGLEMREVYFSPPQSVEEVKYLQKDYKMVDGKSVEAGEATPKRSLQILNNEFFAYLIDLGEALGCTACEIKERLKMHRTGFVPLCNGFMKEFKVAETTRVSAKILYNNNSKKETSFLKIHGSYPVYYPYGNDLFDEYKKDRPTLLKLSKWESENGMVKKFTNDSNAPSTDAPATSGQSWAKDGEDPF